MQADADNILLAHGSGGRMTQELIETIFEPALGNPILDRMDDSAMLELDGKLAFTIDGHVVSPLFFPGGDIGRLALTGTVNDLAVSGARPLFISASFIIEEGLPVGELRTIVESMKAAAGEADVQVVAGDTKVVERGAADGVFITTCGIGQIAPGVRVAASGATPGDVVIVSGTLGDHGVAILSRREGMLFDTEILSDCAPLGGMVTSMLGASRRVHAMRDPTRGGLAATLNEIAAASSVSITIEEDSVPYKADVRAACELLGLDPLILANEGKLVAFVAAQDADKVLRVMQEHPLGAEAAVIGRVEASEGDRHRVFSRTLMGSRRVIVMPSGEQLPRIC